MKITQLLREYEIPTLVKYAIPGMHLYRGILEGANPQPYYEMPIRSDRRPLDSSSSGTAMFNNLFEHFHKVPNVRNQSVFCTTKYGDAVQYTRMAAPADVVLLLPHKSSTIAYHPHYSDSLRVVEMCDELWSEMDLLAADGAFGDDVVIHPRTTPTETLMMYGEKAASWGGDFSVMFNRTINVMRDYALIKPSQLSGLPTPSELMIFGAPSVACINVIASGLNHERVSQMTPSELVQHIIYNTINVNGYPHYETFNKYN